MITDSSHAKVWYFIGIVKLLVLLQIGTIVILTALALVVFTLFFVAATVNAIIISLLVSLAVAGGFLSLFFLSLSPTYIGALSVAAFVISTVTVSAVVSILFASGLYYSVLVLFWTLEMKYSKLLSFLLFTDRI